MALLLRDRTEPSGQCTKYKLSKGYRKRMDLREMDAESLELPENSFDAIIRPWGLMFVSDLAGSLGRSGDC